MVELTTHIRSSVWGSGTGKGEIDDVVVVVVAGPKLGGQSAGQRYREGADFIVGDRRLR